MPALNVLANLFSTIYNNELRRKKECIVIPSSKLVGEVLKVLQKNNYIGEFEFIDDGRQGKFRIQLLGRINKCGVISPRFNVKKDEFPDWEIRYLPAVNPGIIIVSTPNGMNHFYKLWSDAEEGNNKYASIDVHWSQVPNRDEEWKKETISNTSEAQFRQEFECEFLGSANTLIHPTKLKTLVFR